MSSFLSYILQVSCASAIFYGYYLFTLRNRKFHQYNRFYLLLAVLASLLVPFLDIPVYFTQHANDEGLLQTISSFQLLGDQGGKAMNEHDASIFTPVNLFYMLYFVLAVIFLARMIFSLASIRHMIRIYPKEKLGDVHIVNTTEPGTPFSFFNWLFWNDGIDANSTNGRQVFSHELFHIKQRHSVDLIVMEIVTIVLWINPFFHLIKKEIKAIHEFLADRHAMEGEEKWSYAELLLMQALGTRHSIVNPFFHNQIKRRIAMITNPKKTSHRYLRQLLVLPLLACVVAIFAFSFKNRVIGEEAPKPLQHENLKPIRDTNPVHVRKIPSVTVQKKAPTTAQLNEWQNEKQYGVWIDGKRIKNSELSNYKASHFSYYSVSRLEKNAVNYGKHYYQVDLMTKEFEKAGKLPTEAEWKKAAQPQQNGALVVIDGEIQVGISANEIELDANVIEKIDVLKGETAISLYGEKGKNGVIVISTSNPASFKLKLKEPSQDPTPLKIKLKEERPVFSKVEIYPEFPGGESGWQNFLRSNLNMSLAKSVPGGPHVVAVEFIIETDGSVSGVRALTKLGHGLEEEAIRVIKLSPKWNAAVQNGKKVRMLMAEKIRFE